MHWVKRGAGLWLQGSGCIEKKLFHTREINAILGSCKVQVMISPSWELKWKTESSPVWSWQCGLWKKLFLHSPLRCVLQCHRKDKACCPYGIGIPEESACHLCQVLEVHQRWVPPVQKYFLCSAPNQSCFSTVIRCCQDGSQVLGQV